jgi:L-ascorbate metabolism protein UlaG (beta-lactamase superfamily)
MKQEEIMVWRLGVIAGLLGLLAAAPVPKSRPKAEIRYVQNSGWVIKTAAHVLVFDYVDALPPIAPLPDDVAVTPRDFGDRSVFVFVTHAHADHYSPTIANWSKDRPDIQYVLGWPEPALPEAHVMKPREAWSSGGVTIRTTGSTDQGVGFLVTTDGLTIFHAGDLAEWAEAAAAPFNAEIQRLKTGRPAIDLAFFPVATGTCEPRPAMWEGVRSAVLALQPKVVFPMHVRCLDKFDIYERFRAEAAGWPKGPAVIAPARRGEKFQYDGKAVKRVP